MSNAAQRELFYLALVCQDIATRPRVDPSIVMNRAQLDMLDYLQMGGYSLHHYKESLIPGKVRHDNERTFFVRGNDDGVNPSFPHIDGVRLIEWGYMAEYDNDGRGATEYVITPLGQAAFDAVPNEVKY